MKKLHLRHVWSILTFFCAITACDTPIVQENSGDSSPYIITDVEPCLRGDIKLDASSQDSAQRTCEIIPSRIVVTGDSLMTLTAAILAGQLGRSVESLAQGGMSTTTLPDVPGPPATVIVGFGTNDLLRLPQDAGALTEEDLAKEIHANARVWVKDQEAHGHYVKSPLAVPLLDPYSNSCGPFPCSQHIKGTRIALNKLLVNDGAESNATDSRFGDNADINDKRCYSGTDRIHMSVECHVRRAQYIVRSLTRCIQ